MLARIHMLPLLSMLLTLASCAKKGVPDAPVLPPDRYHIELTAEFDTTGAHRSVPRPAVAALAVDGPVVDIPALSALAHIDKHYDIVVSVGFLREFSDGSQGHLVQFERFTDLAPGHGDTGLAGRSVELRRFGDGEILSIDLVGHIVGGDRQAEVFDLLFALISPNPPDLPQGGTARRTMRWPMSWGERQGWWDVVPIDWTDAGVDDHGGRRLHHLSYSGEWQNRGLRPRDPGRAQADGTVQGDTWWTTGQLSLQTHRFDWSRTVRVQFPDAPGGALSVDQDQHFFGVLERLP